MNLAYLDHLSVDFQHDGEAVRLVHLYSDAPAYQPGGDDASTTTNRGYVSMSAPLKSGLPASDV